MDKFNHYMNEQFVGKDPNKTKIGEDIFKALKENWIEKIGYIPQKPMALIRVKEPNSEIIKSIGFSQPNDILLDNFGVMLSSCINTGADVQRNVVDWTGVVRTIHFQENGNIRMAFNTERSSDPPIGIALSLGGYIQVGTGTTTPARPDFQIEIPSTISPMTSLLSVLQPVWFPASQTAVVATLINPAALGGSLEECGLFAEYRIGFTSTSKSITMLSHDLTGTINFNAGDHIEVTYTWSLS